ncbi:MAG: pilus assembly protein TadG-related protein [Rhodomicrobium sp.]
MLTWIAGFSQTLISSRRGSVAIQMGILMTVLIGMAGLGTEIPYIMYKHRQMQNAADSAALGGAVALSQGYPAIATEADGIAAALGFTNGTGSVTVTVNNPPKSGNYTSNASAVEVIVSQPQTLKMAGLFGVSSYSVSARAVALAGSGNSTGYCILSTDPIGQGWAVSGVGLWGGVVVTMTGCGMAVNASGSQALILQSGGTLNAPLVSIVGQLDNVWSTVNVTSLKQNQQPVSDPYANVPMPSSAGCDYPTTTYIGTSQTINAGRYCYGLQIGAWGIGVTMNPGIYYIKSGQFSIANGSTVMGSGVTIVLTAMDGTSNYATFSITNGATLTLSALTTGQTAGILFFGDRNAPSSNTSVLSGFTTANLQGAIYLPTQNMQYGSSAGTITGCQQLIAWHVDDYINNLPFNGTCTGTGMLTIGASATLLVE